jgi:holo-ACP synthase CitX
LQKSLDKILVAREQRANIRNKFIEKQLPTISLSLNIPGYPKHNELITSFFVDVLEELKIFLLANRIFAFDDRKVDIIDEAGHFYLTGLKIKSSELKTIKEQTEKFEETHSLGRIIDVDVFNDSGKPISSGKEKSCIICDNKSAVQCMREQNHSYEELRINIFDRIRTFLFTQRTKDIKRKLSEIATKSLLFEVSLSPKPGLVDFFSSGSHSDMDFYTFLSSTSAISQFWTEFAEAGLKIDENLQDALSIVRRIGLKAEKEMYKSTNGVNTQKGLIFLLGLSVFTTAYLFKKADVFDEKIFKETLKVICHNIVENELVKVDFEDKTHGQKTFNKFGKKGAGARFQTEQGFPLVFDEILPFLENNLNENILLNKKSFDEILKHTLLKIISNLDDSNVLYRKGEVVAETLKKMAFQVLNREKKFEDLYEYCLKENISPGGAADMLAVSLFFYFVKQEFYI